MLNNRIPMAANLVSSNGNHEVCRCSPCQRMRVGLILGAMGFHQVRLPARARCWCMRMDAGVLGDWPKG